MNTRHQNKIVTLVIRLLLTAMGGMTIHATDDILIADFEGKDYGNWKVEGEAFGPGPAQGTLPGQMPVAGFEGHGLINSFFKGDATTGTLTSPEFQIERKYIRFLIGGGKDLQKTSLNLIVGGKVVRQSTGPNDKSGGSEDLVVDSWEVGEFVGQLGTLRIVDDATGGWGHINVDDIRMTDRKPIGFQIDARADFKVQHRYLNLPIKNGGPHRSVRLMVDGHLEVANDIELADGTPDWWAPLDVGAWKGRTVSLLVDKLPDESTALRSIEASDSLKDAKQLYNEPLRGQFHFSPQRGWNNDPNGLVYYQGEYHLFFQHNPYGWGWGNMHWGHAVSRDLVHWRELGDVLSPDKYGPMFSGSAVVDWKNSSGFGQTGRPAQILFYTAAGDPTVQCIAYSTDGRKFVKYSGNPVVPQFTGGNRDPKVIWHEASQKWVMTLFVETNHVNTIHFLSSTNLKDWTFMSKIDGFFECPDFFELPVDGDSARKKWVLMAASSDYMVGRFDGNRFTPETPKLKGHQGRGFYAAQTFSDIPAKDGRRIQIGWFQTETKGMPFNQSMTIPLELRLVGTPEGPRLSWNPVRELNDLRATTQRIGTTTLLVGDANPLARFKGELVELRADFSRGEASRLAFKIRGAAISYDINKQELTVNDIHVSAPLRDGRQRLILYCDRAGLEVFASDGLVYIPLPFIPEDGNRSVSVETQGGAARISEIEAYELRSIWKLAGR